MNIEKIKILRDFLVAHPEQHNQGLFGYRGYECGTVACAAGWTVLLFDPRVKEEFDRIGSVITTVEKLYGDGVLPSDRAMEILGLTFGQANHLFIDTMDERKAIDIMDEWAGIA